MTRMATETGTQYVVKGTTGDVTLCDLCGRNDLRKTVILATLDADGNEEERVNYGTDCASRVTGTKAAAIRRQADLADHKNAKARMWANRVIDVYGPVEHASIREQAALYFSRNPRMRDKDVKASAEIAQMLADARAALKS